MSSGKGFFESEEEYRSRISREADEQTIKETTGDRPVKGLFESDDSYVDRISKEANEAIIKDSTGDHPVKGLFESDDSYVDRVSREADEAVIRDSTGDRPVKGFFESDENYDTRIRQEANESILKEKSGERPVKGLFEGDHEYRSRIAHEAREDRAYGEKVTSSGGYNSYAGGGYSGGSGVGGRASGFKPAIIVVGLILLGIWLVGQAQKNAKEDQRRQAEIAANARAQVEAAEAARLYFDFSKWKLGEERKFTNTVPFKFCTRICSGGRSKGVNIRLIGIQKISHSEIRFYFTASAAPKQKYGPGSFPNKAQSDFLLFVYEDSYLQVTYTKKSLYGTPPYLMDANGTKFYAQNGIEGLGIERFNDLAFKAIIPFGRSSDFHFTFEIPTKITDALYFVSPGLNGHANEWSWRLYDYTK